MAVSALPRKADIDWLISVEQNFPVRPEIFPATRLKIPCSPAQELDCKRLILRDDWTQ
jgi:hypothetical protein